MILIALGANQNHPVLGSPRHGFAMALRLLAEEGVATVAGSPIYRSAAVGPGRQRDYWNAVAAVETALDPLGLLAAIHRVERQLGRRRGVRWGSRVIDLDLIDYHGRVLRHGRTLILPHPEAHRRAFVLAPLLDIAPGWRHPRLGIAGRRLLRRAVGRLQRVFFDIGDDAPYIAASVPSRNA